MSLSSSDSAENTSTSQEALEDQHVSAWKRLTNARDFTTLAQPWLELQCELLANAIEGLLAVRHEQSEEFSSITNWPSGQAPSQQLVEAAERCLAEQSGVVLKWDDDDQGSVALAYPISVDDHILGVVAVHLFARDEALTQAMRQLQWGTAWIRDELRQQQTHEALQLQQQTTSALNLMATCMEHEGFEGACQSAVTELALASNSERVSIAFLKDQHARVRAISHSAQFGHLMNLNRLVEAAMDEAADQRVIIVYPPQPDGEPLSLQAHQSLSNEHSSAALMTIPLLANEKIIGALLYERPANQAFDQNTIEAQSAIASLLGPLLEEKRLNDQWWIVKTGAAIKRQLQHLFGPAHALKKAIAFAIASIFLLALILDGEYRVTADASIEGAVKRSIVAAFDGYIKEAPVRAGDLVSKGQLLAAVDDRELALERLKLITEKQEKRFAQERALSERNRAEVNVIKAQVKKAEAQLTQTDEMLARAKLTAPFDGLVVSGDLTQSIGGAVRRGDVLYEVAPLDEYRVVILVPESQITAVEVGQVGQLQVTALPDQRFDIVIDRITPIAQSADGSNTFRVDGVITSDSSLLRPGMKGAAKIDAGQRNLFWIWARPLIDNIKLKVWRWLG